MIEWLFIYLFCIFFSVSAGLMIPPSSAPVLLPDVDEMVVPLHTFFSLTCRGGARLAWDVPFDMPEKTQEDSSSLFVTTITVDSATVMHTGYYTCFYSTNSTGDTEESSIYIYVPGLESTTFLIFLNILLCFLVWLTSFLPTQIPVLLLCHHWGLM